MFKATLLCATLLCSGYSIAAPSKAQVSTEFAPVEQAMEKKDYATALQLLNELAAKGNIQAIYNQGFFAEHGLGMPKNPAQALKFYESASEKNYPVASYVLGEHYRQGTLGLKVDLAKAKKYYEKASNEGFEDATAAYAMMLIAEGKPQSEKLALVKLTPLVARGHYPSIHTKALYDIGSGVKNKQADKINQGIRSLQDLANKGYLPSALAFAGMLVKGTVIPQNLPQAKRIYEELAKHNVPNAAQNAEKVNALIAAQAKKPASGQGSTPKS